MVSARRSPSEKRKETIRMNLLSKRKAIIKEAKERIGRHFEKEKRVLVETALDDGDWSLVSLAEDVEIAILERHKAMLNKIDEALEKLEEGTYGICEGCGQEISEKRLKAIPFAIYCIDCQQMKERLEEIKKEEEREERWFKG